MELSSFPLFFMNLLFFLLSCVHSKGTNPLSLTQPLCHNDDKSALLQFKESFLIKNFASSDPSAYTKVVSWKLEEENGNCCLWEGVECDENTGHVIGLDLSSSFLYGSINSSSSLFRLVHVRRLNLADNHFNYSRIPPEIGHLSRMLSLNLSQSGFSGQVPPEISNMSSLISLDLSNDVEGRWRPNLLKLEKPNLRSLIQNLTGLEQLVLSAVSINSEVPDILANFTSLKILSLSHCGLYGEFPTGIFHLPKLQILALGFNYNLTGHLPEFQENSSLQLLFLRDTRFTGELPTSIGNLNSLRLLILNNCSFTGRIPPSFANLTLLQGLHFDSNHFVGSIPPFLANLTQLTKIDMGDNNFQGPIPVSIFELKDLMTLDLAPNNLSGIVEVDMLLKLRKLSWLELQGVTMTKSLHGHINATYPKLKLLGLISCNLNEFPEFLRYQDELEWLELADNNINGLVPNWIWSIGVETLAYFSVSNNSLAGFEQLPSILPWKRLGSLDLSFNLFEGSLPIPPPTITYYRVTDNRFTGEIPPSFCEARSLDLLDLSNSKLSGKIPECLGSSSDQLTVLNLRDNTFHGAIPWIYHRRSKLVVIDFSQNYLEGPVPRALSTCTKLEYLNLGHNQITDIFPFWLGTLPELKILLLRSNQLHGAVASPYAQFGFSKLRIVDLSGNNFTGNLPTKFFESWKVNQNDRRDIIKSMYVEENGEHFLGTGDINVITNYPFTMTLTNKGHETFYGKIYAFFSAMDLSCNKFEGEIPTSIGNLTGLQLLNLSNNALTGPIPASLGNLTELEALDLSRNKLSGQIPEQLRQLNFLEFLNVSQNHLTGRIPQGKQWSTFDNSSFEGNSGLCGNPLSKKCQSSNDKRPLPSDFQKEESKIITKTDWIFVCMGYASGIVVGWIGGHILMSRKHYWFMRNFGINRRKYRNRRGLSFIAT